MCNCAVNWCDKLRFFAFIIIIMIIIIIIGKCAQFDSLCCIFSAMPLARLLQFFLTAGLIVASWLLWKAALATVIWFNNSASLFLKLQTSVYGQTVNSKLLQPTSVE